MRLHAVPSRDGNVPSYPLLEPPKILPRAGSLIRTGSVHDVALFLLPTTVYQYPGCPAWRPPCGPKFERADRSYLQLQRCKQAPSLSSVALFTAPTSCTGEGTSLWRYLQIVGRYSTHSGARLVASSCRVDVLSMYLGHTTYCTSKTNVQ